MVLNGTSLSEEDCTDDQQSVSFLSQLLLFNCKKKAPEEGTKQRHNLKRIYFKDNDLCDPKNYPKCAFQ